MNAKKLDMPDSIIRCSQSELDLYYNKLCREDES